MTTTKPNCPKCGAVGQVFKQNKDILSMECPKCPQKWISASATCKKCGKPNGFAVDGLCGPCYSTWK